MQWGHGPSDGTCWWFGQWELVYGDIMLDGSGNAIQQCTPGPTCLEPYLTNTQHVNPRDVACNPICDITGTGSVGAGNTMNISSSSSSLTSAVVGTGIHLSLMDHGVSGDFYATIQCYNGSHGEYPASACAGSSSTKVTLSEPVPSTFTGAFEIHNFTVFEPHWYVKNLGDLYFTTTVQPVYHNGSGYLYNETTENFQSLNYLTPPYNYAGTGSTVAFDNTTWNEFLTPDPTLTHFLFMSDRATAPANFAINPEWSDHYLCSGPNCANPVRLTYYNDSGLDAPGQCGSCFPITAVRGAWLPPAAGPTSLQYLTLVEFLSGQSHPHDAGARLYL